MASTCSAEQSSSVPTTLNAKSSSSQPLPPAPTHTQVTCHTPGDIPTPAAIQCYTEGPASVHGAYMGQIPAFHGLRSIRKDSTGRGADGVWHSNFLELHRRWHRLTGTAGLAADSSLSKRK